VVQIKQFDTSGYIDLDSYLKKNINFIIYNNEETHRIYLK